MTSLFSAVVAQDLLSTLRQKKTVLLCGLPGGSKAFFIAALAEQLKSPLVIVTAEDLEAEGISADLDAWTTLLAPEERPAIIYLPELDEAMRIAALGAWTGEKRAILLCSKTALDKPAYSPTQLKTHTFELRPGGSYPRTDLLEKLAQGGFSRTDMVEMEGEVAVRGEVVDIWPAGHEKPWRCLFDGDVLESIRAFSPGSQRSEGYLGPQTLLPFKETKPAGTLRDYIPQETRWFCDEIEPLNPGEGELIYSGLPRTGAIDLGYLSTTGLATGVERAAQEARAKRTEKGKSFLLQPQRR